MTKEFPEKGRLEGNLLKKKVFTSHNCPDFFKFIKISASYTTNYKNIGGKRFSISNIGGHIPPVPLLLPVLVGTADGKLCRGKIERHLEETVLIICLIVAS